MTGKKNAYNMRLTIKEREESMATGKALDGKPYAGNPHVRFDEGEVAPAATPRRGSLLYKKTMCAWMLAMAGILAAADQDAALREAQRRERGGQAAEAAKVFRNVYGDAQASAHQRLAALCGLLRTDTARLAEWSRTGLGSKDELWSGTVAQALALLPPDRIESARAAWMRQLPPAALLKVMRAVVHVKSPAAKAFLADALAKCADPAVRRFALEGTGRVGAADDVPMLLTWMHGDDAEAAEAARRGLIQLGDVKADAALVGKLKDAALFQGVEGRRA